MRCVLVNNNFVTNCFAAVTTQRKGLISLQAVLRNLAGGGNAAGGMFKFAEG